MLVQNISRNKVIFNGNINGRALAYFTRKTSKDSLMKELINIDRPTHLFYSSLVVTNNGDKKNFGSLIIVPNDTVKIEGNKITSRYSFDNYIDSILDLKEEDYELKRPWLKELIQKNGLELLLKKFNDEFEARNLSISNKKDFLSSQKINLLLDFNLILRNKKITSIPFNEIELNQKQRATLDSLYSAMNIHVKQVESINSGFCLSIIYNMIRYDSFKKGTLSTNFWDYVFKTDPQLQRSYLFDNSLIAVFQNAYNTDSKILNKLLAQLKVLDKKTDATKKFETVLLALDQSNTDFHKGKLLLTQIDNGKYSFLLGNKTDETIKRNINTLNAITFIAYNDQKSDFKQNILKTESVITVLDFWATWCIPCIQDHPYFEKTKQKFKNKPIRFISFSIDKDLDHQKWKSLTSKLNKTQTTDQFRLLEKDKLIVMDFFKIQTIPRYIVLNQKGEVLNIEFLRPNDPNFSIELNNYLSSK